MAGTVAIGCEGASGARFARFAMRILVFHGYLLRGTGSNVYNARLAAALARGGAVVDPVCPERPARDADFVDPVGARGGRGGGAALRRGEGEGGGGRPGGRGDPRAGAGHGVAPRHRAAAADVR